MITLRKRWRAVLPALVLAVFVLGACGSDSDSESSSTVTPEPTAQPTPQPTLDVNQFPVLGDNPAPPVPVAATDDRYPIEPASGETLETGRQLYDRYCASCHGVQGEGEQPDPYAPGSAPPHNADGHTWHHADHQNFLTVWQGRSVAGVMPGYYERLAPDEIITILAYIKTWWLPEQLERQMELTRSVSDR